MKKNSKILPSISIAVLITATLVGISSTFVVPAFAYGSNYNKKIPIVVTIPLEGKSLEKGQFLLISDTTPVLVNRAHIALNVHVKMAAATIQSLILQMYQE
jgi:hypothetical protein